METKVKFYLHAPNANKATPVMMVFNYGFKINNQIQKNKKYKRLKMAVGWSIHPKDWSEEFQRIKPNSRHTKKVQINADLGKLESKVLESYQYFYFQGIIPSGQQLKEQIVCGEPVQLYNVKTSIVTYVEDYALNCVFKNNTVKNYKRLISKIKSFEKDKKSTLYFETMDASSIRSFFRFIGESPVVYKNKKWNTQCLNTLADFKKNIRKFFNLAKGSGVKVHCDYKLKEFTPVYHNADAVYLTMKRIQELIKFDLEQASRTGLQRTKDQLIIGCFTGLRNSDWNRLGGIIQNDNGIEYLKVRTKKSSKKTVVSLPMYKPLMDIYNKNGNKFPAPQSNQKFNESVKELGKLMRWNETIKVSINRAYDGEEDRIEEYPFYELLSRHTGRRSFATNAFSAGVNPKFIMQFTGHKKLSDFFNYIKLTSDDNVNLFYEQTKEFFEPKSTPSVKDALDFSCESAQISSDQNQEIVQLHHADSTSGYPVSVGAELEDLLFRR